MSCSCSYKEIKISRGTTVSLILTVKNPTVDLTDAKQVWVSFFQNDELVLRLELENLSVTSKMITANLTEEQTLAFKSIPAKMQMRAILSDDRRIAQQPPVTIEVLDILDDGEIT